MSEMKLILASKSPRRQNLLGELGIPYEIRIKEVDEIYPEDLSPREVPEYLARLKAEPLLSTLQPNEILITSDTIVLLEGKVIGKPRDFAHAKEILQQLSGKTHEVITGVALHSLKHTCTFSSVTKVSFDHLKNEEIDRYVHDKQPLDKAGAYGIQEWIGYIGVKGIEGCYYNVMGLPLHDLYHMLKKEFELKA